MDLATNLRRLIAAAALAGWATGAQAVIMTFGDRASWELAAPGVLVDVDFETPDASAAATGGAGFINVSPLFGTPQGVDFSITPQNVSDGAQLFLIHPDLDPDLTSQVLTTEQNQTGVQNVTVTLPALSQAFALEFASLDNIASVQFNLSNGESTSANTALIPDFNFLGVVTDTPFNSIDISVELPASDSLNIDNFAFTRQTAGSVPLPATLPLAAMALLTGLAALRRRARQRA